VSKLKFVIVGGGSVNWMPHLAMDLFMTEELRGSRLVLVDINEDAARLMEAYCKKLAEHVGGGWTVEVADLETALDGADGVCVSISTGGYDAMHNDYTIPGRFGIYHSVGDTIGPGGISRTLRNVPVFVGIARKMEKRCPGVWMVHVTNPLAQLTRSVWRASGVRCLGLCHNYTGTRALLAKYFGGEMADVTATSVGVNHFTWLKDITFKGKDVSDQLTLDGYWAYEEKKRGRPLRTRTLDDEIAAATGEDKVPQFVLNFTLHERFGFFPVGAASHVAENLPYYMNSPEAIKRYAIYRKGVLPGRREAVERKRRKIADRVEGREPMPDPEESADQVAPVMKSLCTGETNNIVANLPNEGQISNLPRDVVVETFAMTTWNRAMPVQSGAVPHPIAAMVQSIVEEEELAIEAALTGDRKIVEKALYCSPLVANKDCVSELAEALIQANLKWLPQFQS